MAAGSYSNNIAQANTLAARTVMLTDMMDELIYKETVTSDMTPNEFMVRATQEANKFQIATANTQALGDYDRQKGYPMGSTDLTWEEYTLRYDRARGFMLDRIDIMQTGGLASAAYMMSQFMRLYVIPEVDATRIAGCVARAQTTEDDKANVVYSQTLTKADIITKLREGFDNIFQNMHIESGLTVYMDAQYRNILQGSTEFTRVKDVSGNGQVNGVIDMVDGNTIKWVPSSYMKTAFDYNDGVTDGETAGGFKPNASAKSVNFLIKAPDTAYGIVSVQSDKYITRENNILADADFMALRIYHDVIVPKNRIPGLYVSVKEAKARDEESVEAGSQTVSTAKTTVTKARKVA